jgi:hypothetical protein
MAGQEAGEPDLAPPADEQPRDASQSPPWAEDEGSGGKPFTAEGEPAAGAEAREADDARPGEGSDRRRNRRDRFGRSRGRRGDRNGRPDREGHNGNGEQHERSARPENDDGREGRREYRGPQLNATPREPQPQIIIPDVIPDPEPRKWQPPAPTVQAEPTEKKGGWWSRRK